LANILADSSLPRRDDAKAFYHKALRLSTIIRYDVRNAVIKSIIAQSRRAAHSYSSDVNKNLAGFVCQTAIFPEIETS
jgi:hypothetical protein